MELWPVLVVLILNQLASMVCGAIMAPPWANPKLNPCASQPRGWQLLHWPPDGKCYKIFQMGYPCPDDMELSPSAVSSVSSEAKLTAECRCPPKTAQSKRDGKCYELFSRGPCEKAQFFAPNKENTTNSKASRHWGSCTPTTRCDHINELFWPPTGRCYARLTRGPCPHGQLLTKGGSDALAQCHCTERRELADYRTSTYIGGGSSSGTVHGCYQHYTRGPCKERGHLFLPDKTCGCRSELPHYHNETEMCFEIGSIGPCHTGEHYQLHPVTLTGYCTCNNGYIRYSSRATNHTTGCYRPYTQGPCNTGHILVNKASCIPQPCPRNELYFPPLLLDHPTATADNNNTTPNNICYRIGTRGPCTNGQVVTFDFRTRPSLDGISYNGVCACATASQCDANSSVTGDNSKQRTVCDSDQVLFRGKCYKLYGQGPCARGAWLVPRRRGKKELYWDGEGTAANGNLAAVVKRPREGYCDCMPGYTKLIRRVEREGATVVATSGKVVAECLSPTVLLADYLNKNFLSYSQVDEIK